MAANCDVCGKGPASATAFRTHTDAPSVAGTPTFSGFAPSSAALQSASTCALHASGKQRSPALASQFALRKAGTMCRRTSRDSLSLTEVVEPS